MSNTTTISIGWKIEDAGGGFKTVTMSAEDLRKVLRATVEESEKLGKKIINLAALSTSIDSLSGTFSTLLSVVDDLGGAYDVQKEVETQLEQVMRNTMHAREEDIQSIKDFCSAQQQIGVVGDEVQLAGAQEMATYLEYKSSLQSLIPVMNDMLAQQYGLAASGEAAAQIGSMLGKVMEGQTGALSRYGYKFDEAQEKILKYGTEAEKVAVLVDVVSASVGGMNRALAQTDAGRMQQIKNNIGDLKEQLGGLVKGVQPILTIGANATIALGGVVKLIQGLKVLITTLNLTKMAAGGIALGLTAMAGIITWFMTASGDAADSLDRLKTAEERAADAAQAMADAEQTAEDARKAAASSIELNIAKLKNFNGTKAEEKKLVKEMNDTYGETMGYFKSVASWYQALIKNSKAYCVQMVAEAKARKYADRIAELEFERDKIAYNDDGSKKMYSTRAQEYEWKAVSDEDARKYRKQGYEVSGHRVGGRYVSQAYLPKAGTSPLEKAQATVDDYKKQIGNLREKMQAETAKVEMPVMGESKKPELENKKESTRLQEINKLLAKYQEQYVTASETQKVKIREKVAALTQEKDAIELAQAELQRPLRLDSLEAYNKEIAYQTKLRQTASAEDLNAIDEEISRLQKEKTAFETAGRTRLATLEDYENELSRLQSVRKTVSSGELSEIDSVISALEDERDAFERAAKLRVPVEKIDSYRQLEEQIALCNDFLREGTEEEKRWATENLPLFRAKERAMSAAIAGIGVAERPEDANNLEEMDAAISLLNDKIQRASAEEIEALERTRLAFEKKKKAFERGIEIPAMQKEAADIRALPDMEMKVKIDAMGFEGLSEKIREIQKQLDDLDNPPTEGQRKALEELKGTYEEWRNECVKSSATLADVADSAGKAFQGLGKAFEVPVLDVAGILAGTIATILQGYAQATLAASQTGNPFVWAGFALSGLAQVTAMISQIKSVSAFADGGVVYGPTLGLVGEYAGARSNPEVIAPLNKLRDIIGTRENAPVIVGGRIELSGRTLTLLLENQSKISGLSGKRRP